MFYLDELPEKLVVVGGGYIAVEFAGIMAGLGVQTTLMYRGPMLLRGFDQDIRRVVTQEIRKKEVTVALNVSVTSIKKIANQLTLLLDSGKKIHCDTVLYATGRHPLTENLELEKVGVKCNTQGAIEVNQDYQTAQPNIFALGDVIDRFQLTPVAIAEAMSFAHRQFGTIDKAVNYSTIPTCVFCQPNIGTIGPTEEQAREQYASVSIYESEFKPMKYTLSGRQETIYMKLIIEDLTDSLIAAHMVGPDAGEIIQGFAVAITAGATKANLDSTIGIHPTAAEEFVTMRTKRSGST